MKKPKGNLLDFYEKWKTAKYVGIVKADTQTINSKDLSKYESEAKSHFKKWIPTEYEHHIYVFSNAAPTAGEGKNEFVEKRGHGIKFILTVILLDKAKVSQEWTKFSYIKDAIEEGKKGHIHEFFDKLFS